MILCTKKVNRNVSQALLCCQPSVQIKDKGQLARLIIMVKGWRDDGGLMAKLGIRDQRCVQISGQGKFDFEKSRLEEVNSAGARMLSI